VKKFLRAIALISLVPAIVAVFVIVALLTKFESIPALRMAMVNIYSGTPAAIVRLDLHQALRDRDFQRALRALKQQKLIAEAIGFTRFMRHDLIENSSRAIEAARLSGTESQFLDWALELREIAPMDYLGLTLLSRIQTRNNAEAAIDAANKARNALPVDETTYRALIQRGFLFDGADQIARNCQLYAKAQIGAFDPRYAPTASLVGQGIRTLALAFDGDATEPSYAISQGMKLGQPARNIFDVKSDDDSPLTAYHTIRAWP
jgi:hypothetical protein